MRLFLSIIILASSSVVSAHGHIKAWTINGGTANLAQKAGWNPALPSDYGPTAQRPTDNTANQGPADYRSGVVACGGTSAPAELETWDLDAGSRVTAHWYVWPIEHKGSIQEYMARCPGTSCDGVAADSLDWFKIASTKYLGDKWPTEILSETLEWTFDIPSDLAPGPYLVRQELLAMHFINAPQVYPVCFQANLRGPGISIPTNTVKFPAAYEINTDFLTFDVWNGDQSLFTPPGPAIYTPRAKREKSPDAEQA